MNQRIPVAISLNRGTIVTTGGSATFAPGNARDAMENYLRLVRRMRSQRRDREVNLRQRDIDAMAIDLRMPADRLAADLTELMEQTRTRLPYIGGTIAVSVAAVSATVIGVPAVVNMLSETPAATEPQTGSQIEGNVSPASALNPSSGTFTNAAGEEFDVTFGGGLAPPAP